MLIIEKWVKWVYCDVWIFLCNFETLTDLHFFTFALWEIGSYSKLNSANGLFEDLFLIRNLIFAPKYYTENWKYFVRFINKVSFRRNCKECDTN